MSAKRFLIKNVARYPTLGEDDTLSLKEGVNIIVGEMSVGKTRWLQMIDFALGDDDTAAHAFTEKLADKYDRITLIANIAGQDFEIERRWKDIGAKSKVFVNNDAMDAKEFSRFILGALGIPVIHVPRGNPYADRSWPELSWRELLRHIYKQERFWSDFAQKQLEVVRSACVLHFLDAATHIYSKEFGEIVAKQKEKTALEAKKDVFVGVMQDIAVDLVGQPEMTVSVTPDSVDATRKRLNERLSKIEAARSQLLETVDHKTSNEFSGYEKAKQNLESMHRNLGQLENERNQNSRRYTELVEYAKALESELARFARAKSAASVFADLKVTHCPACDQEIPDNRYSPENCRVCGQIESVAIENESAGKRRIEFEEQQITEELPELKRLLSSLEQDARAQEDQISHIQQEIRSTQQTITAAQALSERAIPPELALLDREAGKISAELIQLERIEHSLKSRDEMNARIAVLDEEISTLDVSIKGLTPNVNFDELEDVLGDRMNDYLNLVNADELSRWKTGRVSVKLRKDSFRLLLDGEQWDVRAGGTANYIVQIAYHYALLSLTKDPRYNYPGFMIIDFPPHFAKADDLRDSESYLLQPFVKLCAKNAMRGTQVLIAGRAFDNLEDANVIQL